MAVRNKHLVGADTMFADHSNYWGCDSYSHGAAGLEMPVHLFPSPLAHEKIARKNPLQINVMRLKCLHLCRDPLTLPKAVHITGTACTLSRPFSLLAFCTSPLRRDGH